MKPCIVEQVRQTTSDIQNMGQSTSFRFRIINSISTYRSTNLQGREEEVDDLVLLDWHREVVDVIDVADLAILNEASELGAWDPLLLVSSLSLSLLALALAFAFALAAETAVSAKTAFAFAFASLGRSLGHLKKVCGRRLGKKRVGYDDKICDECL